MNHTGSDFNSKGSNNLRQSHRASSDLTKVLSGVGRGTDTATILFDKMKKSGFNMGGFRSGYGHSSLLMPGPVPKPDVDSLLQAAKYNNS